MSLSSSFRTDANRVCVLTGQDVYSKTTNIRPWGPENPLHRKISEVLQLGASIIVRTHGIFRQPFQTMY
jgi:hypothetical protein